AQIGRSANFTKPRTLCVIFLELTMRRFDSYLYKAVKGDEDSITELLVNLMKRKYLRFIILRSLEIAPKIVEEISFSDIHTQTSENQVGRPDIVIENKNVKIYIEVKTRLQTVFQETQLSTYPDNLRFENKYTKLIFLFPNEHKENDQINEIKKRYNKSEEMVAVVYWDSLLKELQEQEIANDNSIVNEIISFISARTLKRKIETVFSAMEVALMHNYKDLKVATQLMFKFRRYIQELAEEIDEKMFRDIDIGPLYKKREGKFSKNDFQFDENGIGIYLDDGNLYIGFSFLDERFEDYAFSVAFYPPKFVFEKDEKGTYQNDECTYVKIDDKYVLAENKEDNFIKSIINTVRPYYKDKYIQKNDT
ncbi:MAG: hypothetical protein ACOCWM_01900, partial [Cyclobacteriaceae bacterium]